MIVFRNNFRAARASVVGLMIALSMASYINRTGLAIAGPEVMKEFRFSETEMGSVYSAMLLSYALLMPWGGRLADRFGPRRVLAFTTLGTGVFTVLTALMGWVGAAAAGGALVGFQVVRFGLGAFAAPLYPACARMNANWLPATQRARVQGLILSGAPLGSAITPLLLAWLIGMFAWRRSFVLVGAGTAVLALIWLVLARDTHAGKAEGRVETAAAAPRAAWGPLLRNRNLLLLSFSYFCLNYFEYIFFYWIYYYFGQIRKVPAAQSAAYTSILLFAMMIAMPAAGWFSDRLIPRFGPNLSRRMVAVGGMAVSALLLYLGTTSTSVPVVVALLSLALGAAAGAEGPAWATAIEAGGAQAGAASGIMNGIGNLGGLLAPVLTPYVAQRAGWSAGLLVGSVVVFTGALAWFFINPEQKPVAVSVAESD